MVGLLDSAPVRWGVAGVVLCFLLEIREPDMSEVSIVKPGDTMERNESHSKGTATISVSRGWVEDWSRAMWNGYSCISGNIYAILRELGISVED